MMSTAVGAESRVGGGGELLGGEKMGPTGFHSLSMRKNGTEGKYVGEKYFFVFFIFFLVRVQ